MLTKLVSVFVIHFLCVVLLLIPDKFQGPVLTVITGTVLRAADVIALTLCVSASAYLFVSLKSYLKMQKEKIQKVNPRLNEKHKHL